MPAFPPLKSGAPGADAAAPASAANRTGILAMLGAMTFFIVGDTFMKLATVNLPVAQAVALRGLIAVPIGLGTALWLGGRQGLTGMFAPRVMIRNALEIAIVFAFLTALARLPLGTLTAISQTLPLMITLLAVVAGLERVGIRRWAAIVVGFLGVLLVTRPDVGRFEPGMAIALFCAFLVAIRDLFTRTIVGTVPSAAITASSAIMVALSGAVVGAFGHWVQPTPADIGWIVAAGLVVIGGNLMVVIASRVAEVSVVTPYRYAVVPMGLAIGFAVWGEVPDPVAAIGMILIVGAGLYTFHREIVRARAARIGAGNP